MELVHAAQLRISLTLALAKFSIERQYAVAYVLGSFRDSPAPRIGAAVAGRPPYLAFRGSGLGLGDGHAGRVTLPGFGPVAGTWCRFSPRYRVTKSRTRRCQRTIFIPFFQERERLYPIPPAESKRDFKVCGMAEHWPEQFSTMRRQDGGVPSQWRSSIVSATGGGKAARW